MCFHAQLEMTAGTDAIALLVSATSKGQAGRQAGRLKDQLRQVQPYIGNEIVYLVACLRKACCIVSSGWSSKLRHPVEEHEAHGGLNLRFLSAAAGITDTRQLDSVLRSVDQAQGGLTSIFEALAPLERRSVIFTPRQLRQVTCLTVLLMHTSLLLALARLPACREWRLV